MRNHFGYELIDLRMGGVITRLDSTRRRLHSYVEGKISRLEELETERIPYFAEGEPAIENQLAESSQRGRFYGYNLRKTKDCVYSVIA